MLNGKLYTVEDSGVLYATNLDNGEWSEVAAHFTAMAFNEPFPVADGGQVKGDTPTARR